MPRHSNNMRQDAHEDAKGPLVNTEGCRRALDCDYKPGTIFVLTNCEHTCRYVGRNRHRGFVFEFDYRNERGAPQVGYVGAHPFQTFVRT